jgi:adenosine deaminase
MTDLDRFIVGLPKAELHLHIEGTLEPELMFALAERNGVAIPYASVEELRGAYSFTRLQDFLDIYYAGTRVLCTRQDFADLASAYFARAAADGVVHAEIMFDPQAHTDRGVPIGEVIGGLHDAMQAAQAELGMTSKLIMSFMRHLSEEAALATLEQAEPWLHLIEAVGLDSSELGYPPAMFARVYAAARDKGLKLTAHAGEEGPPDYVIEALDLLRVERIDHGNRALEDPALVERLVAAQIPMTVCPLSNVKLCVVDDMARHPIDTMLAKGLHVSVNSDDPAYFGGYIADNYRAVAAARGLGKAQLAQLACNSFTGSYLDDAAIAAHLANVAAFIASDA